MKLYETISAFKDPLQRRLIILEAAVAEAVLEGMDGAVKENLAEIEEIRRKIRLNVSESEDQETA